MGIRRSVRLSLSIRRGAKLSMGISRGIRLSLAIRKDIRLSSGIWRGVRLSLGIRMGGSGARRRLSENAKDANRHER